MMKGESKVSRHRERLEAPSCPPRDSFASADPECMCRRLVFRLCPVVCARSWATSGPAGHPRGVLCPSGVRPGLAARCRENSDPIRLSPPCWVVLDSSWRVLVALIVALTILIRS